MIIGTGLLAQAHQKYFDTDPNVIIFASGVSNSQNIDPTEYLREKELLSQYLGSPKLVYFSTCSIYDKSLQTSPYIQHKLAIEAFIKANSSNYLIIRLPNVVGASGNPNTMFRFFLNKIQHGEEIEIQTGASRYLIDVEDAAHLTNCLVKENISNQIVNVALQNCLPVSKIVSICESFVGKETKKIILPTGKTYQIDTSMLAKFVNLYPFNAIPPELYIENLLKKYYTP